MTEKITKVKISNYLNRFSWKSPSSFLDVLMKGAGHITRPCAFYPYQSRFRGAIEDRKFKAHIGSIFRIDSCPIRGCRPILSRSFFDQVSYIFAMRIKSQFETRPHYCFFCLLSRREAMETPLKSFLTKNAVKKASKLATIFVSMSLIALQGGAQTQGLYQGWESYLDRPDILSMQPQNFPQTNTDWEELKAAHISFIAFLLEAYPSDTKIYFLARDSEHLYDVARLVTKGTKEAKRFHLLNVSRANMRDPNLMPYLKQNGISPEGLHQGEKVLFVDTGFSGTIPRVIAETFPEDVRSKLKTHLLVSSNPSHPSSRSFLVHLNPMINESDPSQMHGSIVSYEHMPRYTDRSSGYKLINGTYHPMSPIDGASDGSVSKEKSKAFMKDLIASWNNPQVRAQFQYEREQARWFHQALQSGSEDAKSQIKERLQIENKSVQQMAEAQVRDFFEVTKNTQEQYKLSPEDLGLRRIMPSQNQASSKKNELIKKFPEWAPVLENPDDKIPELFKKNNWQMIGNLIDANVDVEINKILVKNLYAAPATGIKKDLQVLMIEKADTETLRSLAEYTFSQPHTKEMGDLLKLVIEKADAETLRYLAEYTFSQPHTKEMDDLLKLVIEKADARTLRILAMYTFSQPHTKEMGDLLKLVIEKADAETLQRLAMYTFSQPHTKEMGDLLKLVIEKPDARTLYVLAEHTFSQPHTKDAKFDVLRKAIAIQDPVARKKYLEKNHVNQDVHKEVRPVKTKSSALKFGTQGIKPISSQMKEGDVVTIQNRQFKVVKEVASGRRGIVYQIQGENGAFYALKVAKDSSSDTLDSLAQESAKAKEWQSLGLAHSKVLVQADTYILKTWIPGVSGEEVIKRYKAGDLQSKQALEQLTQLVSLIQAKGAYIGDFRPPNVIWTGKAWVIIDSGSIHKNLNESQVLSKWNAVDEKGPKFERRWQMPAPQNPGTCHAVFQ